MRLAEPEGHIPRKKAVKKGKEPARQESSTLEPDSQRRPGPSQTYMPQSNKVDLNQLLRCADNGSKVQPLTRKSLISALKPTSKQDILTMMMRMTKAFRVDTMI